MNKLAQVISPSPIPGLQDIYNCNPVNQVGCPSPQAVPRTSSPPNFTNLGDILSPLLNIAFYLVIFLAFFWLVWGAFQYILASGKKEELAKARARITWALVGLAVVLMAYFLTKFASEIFPAKGGVPI